MAYDSRFGPYAQTPQQRAYVLQQLQAAIPRLRKKACHLSQQLFARYVAGELTWPDVRTRLDMARA